MRRPAAGILGRAFALRRPGDHLIPSSSCAAPPRRPRRSRGSLREGRMEGRAPSARHRRRTSLRSSRRPSRRSRRARRHAVRLTATAIRRSSRGARRGQCRSPETLDHDPEVEGGHERDEHVERDVEAELAMRLGETPRSGRRATRRSRPASRVTQALDVPGERLQLQPDLLVGHVLGDEEAHRRPPLLHERLSEA